MVDASTDLMMRRFDLEQADLLGHLLRPMECRAKVLLACLHNILMDDEGWHLLEVDSVELLVLPIFQVAH